MDIPNKMSVKTIYTLLRKLYIKFTGRRMNSLRKQLSTNHPRVTNLTFNETLGKRPFVSGGAEAGTHH